jgi:hypothetical protein
MNINFSWKFHQKVLTLTISFIVLNGSIEFVLIYRPHPVESMGKIRGSQKDVVYLGWPIASSYKSPNAGGGRGLQGLSQWVQLCTWIPNKLIPYLTYGVNRVKGGGRAPPTLTKLGRKYHHGWMYARKWQSPVYVLSTVVFDVDVHRTGQKMISYSTQSIPSIWSENPVSWFALWHMAHPGPTCHYKAELTQW